MHSAPFYDKNGIRITKGIFELPDGAKYTIKNINSVNIKQLKPNQNNPLICIVVGIILVPAYGLGLLLIGLGIWWWISQKISHWILLAASNDEYDTSGSQDIEEIREIRSALDAANELPRHKQTVYQNQKRVNCLFLYNWDCKIVCVKG